VLPLANLSADPENEYFSDGLTEDILTHLSRIGRLKVISRTSVMQYKRTTKNLREIGRELGVATILEGSVRKAGNRVRVTVQLLDAQTDEHLWADTYDRELTDIFAIQSDVAQQIAGALKARVSPEEKARIERRPTESLDAYQRYLKGLQYWNERSEDSVNAAIASFTQAIDLDASYALAYVGLADSYIVLNNFGSYRPREIYPKAHAAVTTALRLDGSLGEAHTSLAQVMMNYDWKWADAEREFQRAIQLNPSYATAHHWYAHLLMNAGRFEEAIAAIGHARELDPLSRAISANVAIVYYFAGRYGAARAAIQRALELDQGFATAHLYLGFIALTTGAYADALSALLCARELGRSFDPLVESSLGVAYAKSGDRTKAQTIAASLEERYRTGYVAPVWIAVLYAGLDEPQRAIQWLERGYEDRDPWMRIIRAFPLLDSPRREPGIADIVRKAGLYGD
jgi:TolB-like protein/Flp pilus assembly protein TadD